MFELELHICPKTLPHYASEQNTFRPWYSPSAAVQQHRVRADGRIPRLQGGPRAY